MKEQEFIEQIAKYVRSYAPKYGIKVCSPIIAQACLESSFGKSAKASKHNYYGLKYRRNRVNCHNGYFNDFGSEQLKDGTYIPITTDWYSFANMEKGVEGYFQFIDAIYYANTKGITDPYEFIRTLYEDGYATDLEYVTKIMSLIKKYDLEKYDSNLSFRVMITVDELNIRQGAGTSHKIVGCIKGKGIYTIVETNGNWGRLKSGAGWINISSRYAKRVD